MEQNKSYDILALTSLLEDKRYTDLIRELDRIPPVDAADFLSELDEGRLPVVFRLLKKDTAAAIFAEMEPELQSAILARMNDREVRSIFDDLYLDDAADLLEELPAGVVKRLMKLATPETRAELNRLLSYPDNSVGSVMTSEFIDLRRDMTCADAIARIRKIGLDSETVYVAYVTDPSRVLEGVVPLKKLLFASPETPIAEIMDTGIVFAYTGDDREVAANAISHYDLLALPVVDKEKRLVGIVTVDDAMDVIEDEATADIERMAAILPTDKPYTRTGVFETFYKRVPWLLLLMLTATLTGSIISHYEAAIGTYAVLTVFFPMLMGTGGNAGSQSSVAVIRSLSLGEIETRDLFRVLWKELRVSMLCGVALSVATFIKLMLIDFKLQLSTVTESGMTQNNLVLALIISSTLFFVIVVAKLVGTVLPIAAKRIGLDPAVMASPFITTVVDTVSLIIYFSIASRVLGF